MITLSKGGAYLLNGNEVIEVGDDSEEILKSKKLHFKCSFFI